MTKRQQQITIQNSLRLVKKSEDPFAPLKEAITNSFDAIKGRLDAGVNFTPNISLRIFFRTQKNTANEEEKWLDCIEIEDNGIGFVTNWFERYMQLAENTKQMNNRGTGKLQMFHRFNKISLDSIFYENKVWKRRTDTWNLSGDATEPVEPEFLEEQADTKTIVKLEGFYSKEDDFYVKYLTNPQFLKQDILRRLLLRLYHSNEQEGLIFNTSIICNGKIISQYEFNETNIPKPDKTDTVVVFPEKFTVDGTAERPTIKWEKDLTKQYVLEIKRFAIASDVIDENTISMCSKDIEVEKFPFALGNNKSDYDGYRYITSISGEVLNDNVNDSVDKFTFQKRSDAEKTIKESVKNGGFLDFDNERLYRESINDSVSKKLDSIYSDVKKIEEDKKTALLDLARQHGIPEEVASNIHVEIGDKPDKIVEKMYVLQAKIEAKENIETIEKYNSLKQLNPLSPTYKENFSEISAELLAEIPQQNKDELARYVIRRNMIVDLLKMSLQNLLDVQAEWEQKKIENPRFRAQPEKLIQNLIFPKGKTDKSNNLWILNEEFVHFDGYADTRLEDIEINGEKLLQDNIDIKKALEQVDIEYEEYASNRPDICLFPEEGKCILIEFKAPEVDLAQHTSQIPKYAKLIANYSRKPQFKFNQFFGYLVGNTINEVKLETDLWNKVHFGDHRVYPSKNIKSIGGEEGTIANLYQEMIKLSGISNRAALRNKSFSDKLGLTQLDLNKVQEAIETK